MKIYFLLVLVLVIMSISGCAQQPNPGYVDEGYYISGYVYMESGKPVEYVSVEASCEADGIEWGPSSYTDYKGFFELRMEKTEGFCLIKASSKGFSDTEFVSLDGNSKDVELVLEIADRIANGTLQGYITDPALKPIKGVIIEESYNGLFATTDENGFYRFGSLRPGRLTLVLKSPRFEMEIIDYSVAGGEDKELNYSMSIRGVDNGMISGTVTVNRTLLENATVITLARGELLSERVFSTGSCRTEAN